MLYKPGKGVVGGSTAVNSSSQIAATTNAETQPIATTTGKRRRKQHQLKHQHQHQHQHHHRWPKLGQFLSSIGHLSWFGSHHNLASPSHGGSGDVKADDGTAVGQRRRPWLRRRHRSRQPQHPSAAVSCQNLARQSATSAMSLHVEDAVDSTDNDDDEDSEEARRPGANRVAKWATGLAHLLADPDGVGVFAEFLRSEFSEENVNFWLAVEEFRALAENAGRSDELLVAARRIARAHIGSDAAAGVNLDGATERDLRARLVQSQPQAPPVDGSLFDAAQRQIFNLMRLDSYVRFLKSAPYKDCLLCELQSRPLPTPPSGSPLRCSADSLAAAGAAASSSRQSRARKASRDLSREAPASSARQIVVKPVYRSRQPSLIVAALDLDCGHSVC